MLVLLILAMEFHFHVEAGTDEVKIQNGVQF